MVWHAARPPAAEVAQLVEGATSAPVSLCSVDGWKGNVCGIRRVPRPGGPPRDTRPLRGGELADPRLRERACRCEVRPRGVARGELSIPSHENVDDARDVLGARARMTTVTRRQRDQRFGPVSPVGVRVLLRCVRLGVASMCSAQGGPTGLEPTLQHS